MQEKLLSHNDYFNTDFTLPPEGLTSKQRTTCLEEFTKYIDWQKNHFLGYQTNQKMEYEEDLKHFLNCHINNIGDPFIDGNFMTNSKQMEKAVLDYYAKLWNAKLPHNPYDAESYWGYILTMGSTEGNLYGLWNARDYLAGLKLVIVNRESKNKYDSYIQPKMAENDSKGNPNAFNPVAFYSQDTHYSITKIMHILGINTFSDIGQKFYAGKNPIHPSGEWAATKEVPSLDGNAGPGTIDIDKLVILVEFFASKGYPIMVCCNYGSTFKGAYDNVEEIETRLMPIFKNYGLENRTVEYEKGKTDTRNGYWIHVDGALGASYMPFIEMAHQKNLITERGPQFDFRLQSVNSIVMSGHKWPGAPWPCGIFMSKVKYQLFPPSDPEYIGSPDSTFAGSRNGLSSVIFWDYLSRNSYDTQINKAVECTQLAQYTVNKLKTLRDFHSGVDLFIERSPLSLTVRFRKPNDKIVRTYSLSCEAFIVDGVQRDYAHIFIMPSVNKELIDDLVNSMKVGDAFPKESIKMLPLERAHGWR